MIRIALLITLSGLITSCSGSSGSSGTTSGTTTPAEAWKSFSVATATALPACAGDIVGRLYYVEDTLEFKACKNTGWTVVSAGRGITSIKSIASSSTDFCTQYAGESCLFRSGQMVTYTDGSVHFTVGFSYLLNNAGEMDSDEYQDNFLVPSTYTGVTKGLYPFVARGSGYKPVHTTWDKATGIVRYYLDTNNPNTCRHSVSTGVFVLKIYSH